MPEIVYVYDQLPVVLEVELHKAHTLIANNLQSFVWQWTLMAKLQLHVHRCCPLRVTVNARC